MPFNSDAYIHPGTSLSHLFTLLLPKAQASSENAPSFLDQLAENKELWKELQCMRSAEEVWQIEHLGQEYLTSLGQSNSLAHIISSLVNCINGMTF